MYSSATSASCDYFVGQSFAFILKTDVSLVQVDEPLHVASNLFLQEEVLLQQLVEPGRCLLHLHLNDLIVLRFLFLPLTVFVATRQRKEQVL